MTRSAPPVLLVNPLPDAQTWLRLLAENDPELTVRVWPELPQDERPDVVVGFTIRDEHRDAVRDVRLVIVPGAGVDGVLRNTTADVAVSRVVDPGQAMTMTQYVVGAVMKYVRRLDEYGRQQRAGVWLRQPTLGPAAGRVGILGLGTLGGQVGQVLQSVGVEVIGWSRTHKSVPGITCHAGAEELPRFLAQTGILVCLLPLTDATRRLLDRDFFAQLPQGARLISVGRGEQVVEDDLIAALDSGQLAGATLDVCQTEPLPQGHPLWTHPLVDLTPHIAGTLRIEDNVAEVARQIRSFRAGGTLLSLVDRQRGY
ncbi:MAG: glyoxylate/hydroxypyruvate reductase A [Microbacterium sp.]